MENKPEIHTSFEPNSGTWQYIISDPSTLDCIILDSVLDFDPATNQISTTSADKLLALVNKHNYKVTRILETHAHADHLTASSYLQTQLLQTAHHHHHRPLICIGKRITEVQATFGKRYGIDPSELHAVFDHLFSDNEKFAIGNLTAEVLHLPGHTPDHVGYMIGENVFTGDSIFNPDVGSARADFPGGSAKALYKSMRTLLELPAHYRLYTGHDYPPESREATGAERGRERAYTTVGEQNESNKHAKAGSSEEVFVSWRSERDGGLSEPKQIHQALQFNIRAGHLPRTSADGYRFLHVPLKVSNLSF
ncbi:MAG: hypothetical protein M1830_001999 [Pleopsidium flavum]|nr:MAG: hypothetical protein M1830_001999 [Pleopsidium flavum]